MSESDARSAILEVITSTIAEASTHKGVVRSTMLRDAALAYFLVAGEADPRTVVAIPSAG